MAGQSPTARRRTRANLIATLNAATREAGGLGALFGEAVASRLGINPPDLECLGVIAASDSVTAGDLARATGLTTGAITGIIDRLEKAKLARRARDPEDRRKIYVRMTDAAGESATAYHASLGKAANRLAATYSDGEITLLIDFFARSRDIMLREIERLRTKS